MTLEINIPKHIEESFSNLAKERNITKEELTKRAILEYLQELEDYKDALNARKARQSNINSVEANAFFKSLGV